MKYMEFKYKDIYVKVHTSLIVTRYKAEQKRKELVYANIIDIDSRVQAVFAQFSHLRKADDVYFYISHAPKIGEKEYDKSSWSVRPEGVYKFQSHRENETFVSGIVVNENVLSRRSSTFTIFAWDGNFQEKLFWAIEAYYETPMIEEWIPYIISKLQEDKLLVSLEIHDFTNDHPNLCAYDLLADEETLDHYLSEGLKSGQIVLSDHSTEGGC